MTTPPDIGKRMDRLEKEDVHIYDLIDERTTEIRLAFARTNATLAEHGEKLDEILRRLPAPA